MLPVRAYGDTTKQGAGLSYRVDNWQTEHGLPVNSVMALAQTADGWLWFGTEEGLVRFDGEQFQLFNKANTPELPVNFISALAGTRDSSLWIGTDGGGLLHYQRGAFTRYDSTHGFTGDLVYSLTERNDGGLWIGTARSGMWLFKDGVFKHWGREEGLEREYVHSIVQDRKGRVWIGTEQGLFTLGNDDRIRRIAIGAGGKAFINSLALDNRDVLWIATMGEGLYSYDGTLKNYRMGDGITNESVNSLLYAEDMLWIGTNGGGITLRKEDRLVPFTDGENLSGDLIVGFLQDKDGNIWTASSGSGISRIRKRNIKTVTRANGLPGEMIMPVLGDQAGNIWMGVAGKGLVKMGNGMIRTFKAADGLSDFLILSIAEDKDHTIWIGTAGGGLFSYRGGRFRNLTIADGLSGNIVSALACDRSGTLWIGTNGGGVNRYERGHFTAFTTQEGLTDDNVTCLLGDSRGDLWVATNSGLNVIRDGKITNYGTKAGLSSDYILSLYEDERGFIWIGTSDGGLNLMRDGRLTSFTGRDGLDSDLILGILEDDAGNLWMSSNKGVSKISRQSLLAYDGTPARRLVPVTYGKSDGMESVECNGGVTPSAWRMADGRLLFPTMKGLSIFEPEALRETAARFTPVVIDGFSVDGSKLALTGPHVLNSGTRRIEFRFATLNYSHPERVHYQCRLDGFDRDWIDAGNERVINYTNLPSGEFVFHAMASNENGEWSEKATAAFAFSIRPPFTRTLPFYLLLGTIALVIGLLAFYLMYERLRRTRLEMLVAERTRELHDKMVTQENTQEELSLANEKLRHALDKARESERLKSAFLANMSHEIRTPMNGILGFSELIAEEDLQPETRNRYFNIISQNTEQLLRLINDILDISKIEANLITLRKEPFDLNQLLDNLLTSFEKEKVRMGRESVSLELIKPSTDNRFLVAGDSIKITQILNNLIGNALKFTSKGFVRFGCQAGAEDLLFFVEDSGQGIHDDMMEVIFDRFRQGEESETRSHRGSGLGLSISKGLVEAMAGRIWCTSSPGKGSTFSFTISLRDNQNMISQ